MSHPDPFSSLSAFWKRIDDLHGQITQLERQVDHEVGRLARTWRRDAVFSKLYWRGRERIDATRLARLFGVAPTELAQLAGPVSAEASCLDCGASFVAVVSSRSNLAALTAESDTVNPRHRVCPACRQQREQDLGELRRVKGTRLTAAHREAYRRYLLSAGWRERRKKALRRAKNRCQLCSGKSNLDVHHRTYVRLGDERADDVTVLCRSCHEHHHHVH